MFAIAIESSFASSPLTPADEAFIKEGQRIAETAHQLKQADWQQNAHMDTAQQEAKRFFNELQTSSADIQAIQQSSPNKGSALSYKTLVFASYSLGERGLKDLLESVSDKPDTVVPLQFYLLEATRWSQESSATGLSSSSTVASLPSSSLLSKDASTNFPCV